MTFGAPPCALYHAIYMKLLVISHALGTVVNQSFFADLEEQTGWSITIVLPARWKTQYGPGDMSGRWPSLKADIRHLDVIFPGSIPRHLYRSWFVGLLREIQPDAIYMHHEPYGFATAQVYLANQLAGRCPIGFYAAQNITKRYPAPIRRLERWVMDHSSFAFPVTEGALAILRAKHYAGAAEVLPLAIDPAIYHPQPEWSASRRAIMGFSTARVLFGYMGRLVPEKGLGALLSALEQLDDLPWELILVGGGPMEAELRARVAASDALRGRVHFAGVVPHTEAPHWLSLFDVMVLASETRGNWKEQFGRVLIEALACGTPVIGSDSGEIPNVIRATGGGLIFPEGDAGALAVALRKLAEDAALRQHLATVGRAAVGRLYAQSALVTRFAGVIGAATGAR